MVDEGLLTVANSVLSKHGFATRLARLEEQGSDWVLAESELFVVAVVAGQDLAELREIEAFAVPALMHLLTGSAVAAKRWDTYLVLLAGHTITTPTDARQLTAMEYDTRSVRRLVSVGVPSTESDVRRVLRPFLPLPSPPAGGLADAFTELQEQLVLNGVDEESAELAVRSFLDRGELADA